MTRVTHPRHTIHVTAAEMYNDEDYDEETELLEVPVLLLGALLCRSNT